MKRVACAAAAVVAMWAGSAGAATIVYSLSGAVGVGSGWTGTELELNNLPTTGNLLVNFAAADGPFLNQLESDSLFRYSYFPPASLGPKAAIEANQIYGTDGEFSTVSAPVITASGFTSLIIPQNLEQVSTYTDFLPGFGVVAMKQIYSVTAVETFLDVVLPTTAESEPFSLTVSDVPEPSSWAMMLTGVGFVGAMFRRRKELFSMVDFSGDVR